MTDQDIVLSLSPGLSDQNPIVKLFCESTILPFIEFLKALPGLCAISSQEYGGFKLLLGTGSAMQMMQ